MQNKYSVAIIAILCVLVFYFWWEHRYVEYVPVFRKNLGGKCDDALQKSASKKPVFVEGDAGLINEDELSRVINEFEQRCHIDYKRNKGHLLIPYYIAKDEDYLANCSPVEVRKHWSAIEKKYPSVVGYSDCYF